MKISLTTWIKIGTFLMDVFACGISMTKCLCS